MTDWKLCVNLIQLGSSTNKNYFFSLKLLILTFEIFQYIWGKKFQVSKQYSIVFRNSLNFSFKINAKIVQNNSNKLLTKLFMILYNTVIITRNSFTIKKKLL